MGNPAFKPSQHAFVVPHADDIALAVGNGELPEVALGHCEVGLALRVLELETSLLAVRGRTRHTA